MSGSIPASRISACSISGRISPRKPGDKVMYLEGSDQHRGWFHSSLLTSVAMHGHAPYDEVLTHGFTVDAQGRKMSKSLGNGIEPQEVMKNYGADMLRLWIASADYRNEMALSDEILKRVCRCVSPHPQHGALPARQLARVRSGQTPGRRRRQSVARSVGDSASLRHATGRDRRVLEIRFPRDRSENPELLHERTRRPVSRHHERSPVHDAGKQSRPAQCAERDVSDT